MPLGSTPESIKLNVDGRFFKSLLHEAWDREHFDNRNTIV